MKIKIKWLFFINRFPMENHVSPEIQFAGHKTINTFMCACLFVGEWIHIDN